MQKSIFSTIFILFFVLHRKFRVLTVNEKVSLKKYSFKINYNYIANLVLKCLKFINKTHTELSSC